MNPKTGIALGCLSLSTTTVFLSSTSDLAFAQVVAQTDDATLQKRFDETPPSRTRQNGGDRNDFYAQANAVVLEQIDVQGPTTSRNDPLAGVVQGGNTRSQTDVGLLGSRRVVETPFSTTGYTQKIILNQQAQTISDTLKNDPSVTIPRSRGTFTDVPYIRGFPIGGTNLLFNGLPGLLQAGQIFPLESVERIDVLKGPAAFFYGVSAFGGVGGAVNIVSKHALETPYTSTTFGYAGRTLFRSSADVSRRWGNAHEFGLRINGAYERGTSNVDYLRIERGLGALAFDWQANERLRFSLDVNYSKYDSKGYQNSLAVGPIATLPYIPRAPNLSNSITQPWAYYPTTLVFGVGKVDYEFVKDWTLSASYGIGYAYRPIKPSPGNPTLLNPEGDIRMAANYTDYTAYEPIHSYQGSIRGKFDTGSLKHELIIGSDVQRTTLVSMANFALPAVVSNIYTPRLYDAPAFPADRPRIKTFQSNAFGVGFTDIVSVADGKLFALGGGRYSSLTYANYNGANGDRLNSFDGSRFNPIAAVGVRPTTDMLFYGNYAEAFEQGGIAPTGSVNATTALPPLKSNAFELGAKAEFAGLVGTVAFFQINKGLEYLNTSNRFVQDGRQIHKGVEVLLSGEVLPHLNIITGFQVLNPTVRGTANPANEGHDPVGVARLQTSLFAEYEMPALTGAAVNGGVYHYSGQYADIENLRSIPDWTRFDLGAHYTFVLPNDMKTTARFNVENVLGTNYWSSVAQGALSLGTPRTFKASLTMVW